MGDGLLYYGFLDLFSGRVDKICCPPGFSGPVKNRIRY